MNEPTRYWQETFRKVYARMLRYHNSTQATALAKQAADKSEEYRLAREQGDVATVINVNAYVRASRGW